MGTATSLLVSQIGEGAVGATGSVLQAGAMRQQGKFEQQGFNTNARLEAMRAEDAGRRGALDAQAPLREGAKIRGAQQAAAAAGGVDPGAGSAATLGEETSLNAELDAMTIRNNAWMEAWGHNVASQDLRTRGRMARAGAKTSAGATIATGGMQFGRGLVSGGLLYDKYGGNSSQKDADFKTLKSKDPYQKG